MTIAPYPAVDIHLTRLLDAAPRIMGENFVGMYLYGSLALGDFDPAVSDIDFLVALREPATPEQFEQLRQMHHGIFASGLPLARELEGSYIPLRALRRYSPADVVHPHIDRSEGKLRFEHHDTDW